MPMVALPSSRISLLTAMALISLAASAPAATVLEANFQTYDSGTGVVTGTSKAGTQNLLTLTGVVSGNPSVNPTASTGINVSNANSNVTTGYYTNDRVTGNLAGALYTSGSTGEFRDYFGTNLGTGTIAFVYQPDFTASSGTIQRAFLFGTDVTGTSAFAVQMQLNTDRTVRFNVGLGQPWTVNVDSTAISWDATKWYYVAASWTAGQSLSLYVREVGTAPAGGTLYSSASTLVSQTQSNAKNLVLGNTLITGGSAPDNGKIAYFWAGDTYTGSAAAFDVLYTAQVPEPSAAMLILGSAGLAGMIFRARARSRSAC